jgi:hypothetical protein
MHLINVVALTTVKRNLADDDGPQYGIERIFSIIHYTMNPTPTPLKFKEQSISRLCRHNSTG